jgi:hypothetical protein
MPTLSYKKWMNTLFGMFIQGGAHSAVATFGLAGAHAMGVPVQPLDLQQVSAIFLAGAVIKTMRFLEHSPVPEFNGAGTDTTPPFTQTTKDHENNNETLL